SDKWIAQPMNCQHLPEQGMKILCDAVRAILLEESNIQPVSTPATICGDIHTQFWDLLELLRKGCSLPETSYIFMARSYPDKVMLLRGNHESRVYGFYDESQYKYGSAAVWRACYNVFDFLNLAAIRHHTSLTNITYNPSQITDGETLCVHEHRRIPHEGAFCGALSTSLELESFDVTPSTDLMWPYPDYIDSQAAIRGNVTREFNHVNSLSEGYKYMFSNVLVTVWSAPNPVSLSMWESGVGVEAERGGKHEFKVFSPAPKNKKDKGMGRQNLSIFCHTSAGAQEC
ncbi:Metallo-dependent phosphatase-like protein, partial [Pisolithus tinctorius]